MRKFHVKFDGCGIHDPMTEDQLKQMVYSKIGKVRVSDTRNAGYDMVTRQRLAEMRDFEVHELVPVKLELKLVIS